MAWRSTRGCASSIRFSPRAELTTDKKAPGAWLSTQSHWNAWRRRSRLSFSPSELPSPPAHDAHGRPMQPCGRAI
jgi:hypothetical protein